MNDSRNFQDWLNFAAENLKMAELGLQGWLYNPCLQNVQQAVEKAIKSLFVRKTGMVPRTHSIRELCEQLRQVGQSADLNDEEIDFLDSIYLPSKYPPDAALASAEPTEKLCREAVALAERTLARARAVLGETA